MIGHIKDNLHLKKNSCPTAHEQISDEVALQKEDSFRPMWLCTASLNLVSDLIINNFEKKLWDFSEFLRKKQSKQTDKPSQTGKRNLIEYLGHVGDPTGL